MNYTKIFLTLLLLWNGTVTARMVNEAPVNKRANLLNAFVDKTEIAPGDTMVLTIEFSGQTHEEPDFFSLEKWFTVVSRQVRKETNFVNGNFRAKTIWIFEILPKSMEKNLTIPSIRLGSHATSPIAIKQTETSASGQREDVLLTVTTDKSSVYINAELILAIKLRTPLALRNATLTKPEIDNAIVEALPENAQSEVIENGIKYFDFHQRYAIFPSKSGKLVIPAINFRGVAANEKRRNWSSFFQSGRHVTTRSEPLTVDVKDIPASFPKDEPFLPLKGLAITDSFRDENPQLLVSKTSTRRFRIEAFGTLSSFLPTLEAPTVDGVQIYAEASTRNHKPTDSGLLASNEFSHVYMPSAAKKISIPEETIYWWDTEADQLMTTKIASLEIDVGGESLPEPTPEEEERTKDVETLDHEQQRTRVSFTAFYLVIGISVFLLVLCCVLLIRYVLRRRNIAVDDASVLRRHLRGIAHACTARDAKLAYEKLLALRAFVDKKNVKLEHDEKLRALTSLLEENLFDQTKHVHDEILDNLRRETKQVKIQQEKQDDFLPLYPK